MAISEQSLLSNLRASCDKILTRRFITETKILSERSATLEEAFSEEYFSVKTISRISYSSSLSVLAFLESLLPACVNQNQIDLSAFPFFGEGLPEIYRAPVSLTPLIGVNTCRINDDAYLLWASLQSGSQKKSDVLLLIYDVKDQRLYYGCTQGITYSSFEIILYTFRRCLPGNTIRNEMRRLEYLRGLEAAGSLSHVPDVCPPHFGHYVFNNLGHVARLNTFGLFQLFSTIYRLEIFDFFADCEVDIFIPSIHHHKIASSSSIQDAIQDAKAKGSSVICTKDVIINGDLWRSVHRYFGEDLTSGSPGEFAICVGVRGGTRECLNIVDTVFALVQEIKKQLNVPIALVLDGMCQSRTNVISTSAMLSLDYELKICEEIANLFSCDDSVKVKTVVGLPLLDQLKFICTCNLAFGHQGSSTFKYMYLAGLPCIVHGPHAGALLYADNCDDTQWQPIEIYLGPEFLSRTVPAENAGPFYCNYYCDIAQLAEEFASLDFHSFANSLHRS